MFLEVYICVALESLTMAVWRCINTIKKNTNNVVSAYHDKQSKERIVLAYELSLNSGGAACSPHSDSLSNNLFETVPLKRFNIECITHKMGNAIFPCHPKRRNKISNVI
jgi:hypothetical protein